MALADIASFVGEVDGWPKWKWDEGYFTGVRKIIVGWADAGTALACFDISPDCFWPYGGGPSWTPCRRVEMNPIEGQINSVGSAVASYDKVEMTAYFTTKGPVWNPDSFVWYDEVIEPVREHLTIDPTSETDKLYWDAAKTKPVDMSSGFGRMECSFRYVARYHRVSAVPAWVMSLSGYVNSNVVTAPSIGWVFPAETLLYMPGTMNRSVSPGGTGTWDVRIAYGYRAGGWNKEWRPAYGWSTVYDSTGSVHKSFLSTAF